MKIRIIALIVSIFTVSCTSMTNDQIISEKKKCNDAGMGYEMSGYSTFWGNKIMTVTCRPYERATK